MHTELHSRVRSPIQYLMQMHLHSEVQGILQSFLTSNCPSIEDASPPLVGICLTERLIAPEQKALVTVAEMMTSCSWILSRWNVDVLGAGSPSDAVLVIAAETAGSLADLADCGYP